MAAENIISLMSYLKQLDMAGAVERAQLSPM